MIATDAVSMIGFVLSLVFLGYSAYSDLKTREVSNRVWLTYLPLAAAVLTTRLLLDPNLLFLSVTSIAVTTCLSLIMFYIGIFGGADAKAFICLSAAVPTNPFPLRSLFLSLNPIFPVMVLYTAYFLSASTILHILARNIAWKYVKRKQLFENIEELSPLKKLLAVLTGYKTDLETLRNKVYLYPMEEASTQNGILRRRLRLFVSAETDRDHAVKSLENSMVQSQKSDVWVTPGMPLLLFVLLALLLNGLLGDFIMSAVFQIISSIV